MADVSVDLPARLVPAVRESAMLLYQATAESLHFSLRALGEARATLEEVHAHRARLAQLDSLLDQLGWSDAEPGERRLTGSIEVLADAVYGALLDAGERLASGHADSWRGELANDATQAGAREVIALDRLLRRIKAGGEEPGR